MTPLEISSQVLLVTTFLSALAFPLLYLRSPWKHSAIGRDNMTFSIAVVVVLGLSIGVRIFGLREDWRQLFTTIIFAILTYVFLRRVILLYRIQRDPWGVANNEPRRNRKHRRQHKRPIE